MSQFYIVEVMLNHVRSVCENHFTPRSEAEEPPKSYNCNSNETSISSLYFQPCQLHRWIDKYSQKLVKQIQINLGSQFNSFCLFIVEHYKTRNRICY